MEEVAILVGVESRRSKGAAGRTATGKRAA